MAKAEMKPGEALFIRGGSGNVGSAVLQFARHLGARVIVTAGTAAKATRSWELGASRVVSYKSEDLVAALRDFAPQGVDVYWDTTREPDFERLVPLLKHRGRIIPMAGLNAHPGFPVGAFYTKDCSMHGFAVTNATTEELLKCAGDINRLLAAGVLKATIDRVLPLAEAAAAHRLFEEHHAELNGKIVLVP